MNEQESNALARLCRAVVDAGAGELAHTDVARLRSALATQPEAPAARMLTVDEKIALRDFASRAVQPPATAGEPVAYEVSFTDEGAMRGLLTYGKDASMLPACKGREYTVRPLYGAPPSAAARVEVTDAQCIAALKAWYGEEDEGPHNEEWQLAHMRAALTAALKEPE